MDRVESALNEACVDQRDALRKYHETGSESDAASVHYESCLGCERALEAIATLRAGRRAAPMPIPGNRPIVIAGFALGCALILGAVGFLTYQAFIRPFLDREPATEALRMEARIEFARMPGRPDVCVASLRGVGGFGPTFLGAARCADVRGRIVSDEGFAWRLREYAIVRITGTEMCLAYADGDDSFTLPCGSDD